jgi:uncharacterized membrane protein YidH (DUF202 family)
LRTGLASLAVAVAVGRIAPDVANGARWPYEVVGAGFAAIGVAMVWTGYVRTRSVEEALDRGGFAPLGRRLPLLLSAGGAALGVATFMIVLFAR